MATEFFHSIDTPLPPRTWRIKRYDRDVSLILCCPNGHITEYEATFEVGIPRIPLSLPFHCSHCGFGDFIYLHSERGLGDYNV